MEFKVGDVVEIVADKDGCAETGDKGIVVDFDNNDPVFYDVKMTSGNVKGETKVFYERELKLISTELKAGDRVYVADDDPDCREKEDESIFFTKFGDEVLVVEISKEDDLEEFISREFDTFTGELTRWKYAVKVDAVVEEDDMVEVNCEGNKTEISRKSAKALNLI